MSTRSYIGILQDNGVRYIYCHSDGYVENNGKLLVEHYQVGKKIKQLISLGDISFLASEIGKKHDFDGAYSVSILIGF